MESDTSLLPPPPAVVMPTFSPVPVVLTPLSTLQLGAVAAFVIALAYRAAKARKANPRRLPLPPGPKADPM